MSTTSGIGSKGEKNKSKYKGIDINNLYKGKTVETQKSTVTRQYGLQSLGKVSNVRRMPPPANLPSIRSENSGNDPNISLVPSGGSGWVKEEKKESSGGGAPPPSQPPPQAAPTSQPSQQPAAVKTSTQSGGQSSASVRSWSNITTGIQQGGLVSHQSPLFQEEFPSLALEEKNKEAAQATKKEEDAKDTQYGPGPSLRPQNVASWREGGGRAVPPSKPDEANGSSPSTTPTETQANGPPTSGGVTQGGAESAPVAPRPGQVPHGQVPMGPPMGMPPQYRGMLPPFMIGRFPPAPGPGGYPPNYPGFPRPPYGSETRFRGPPPQQISQRKIEADDGKKRPPIVSEKAFKEFDELLRSDTHEGGWAGPQGEIDYSEKLVFSDEEDESRGPRDKKRQSNRDRSNQKHNENQIFDQEQDRERTKDDNEKEEKTGPSPLMREAWPPGHPPPHYRGQPRPPHPGMDGRAWPPHMHPYEFMGQRGAPPYFRMPPPPQMRPPYGPPPPVSSPGMMPPRKQGEREDDDEMWRLRRRANEGEINSAIEKARHRREENEKRQENERRAAAGEKLRQLEERTKKKDDDKDSENEGRDSRTTSESSDREPKENRFKDRQQNPTPPAQNEGSGSGGGSGKPYSRNVAPRFQKRQEESANAQSKLSPGASGSSHPVGPPMQGFRPGPGQGPPPPHWNPYAQAYGMPPHFMDPRYGPRPPLDMQGMPIYPPMNRRRNDSHGSGEGQESDRVHQDQYDRPDPRDPRAAWMDRGYPPPHPGHFEDMRRMPQYYDRMYQERFDFERRDFDPQDQEEERGTSQESDNPPKEFERSSSTGKDLFEDRKEKKDRETKSFPKESKKGDLGDHYQDEPDYTKLSKEALEREREEELQQQFSHSNRRDGRQRPTPKFRAYTSEELSSRENSQRSGSAPANSPPSLSNDQKSSKNNLASLKRSASNMSSSSAASSDKDRERKSDSPKEVLIFERSSTLKKENAKEQPKEKPMPKENKPPEPVRPNAWEIKDQERQKDKPQDKLEPKAILKDEEWEDVYDEKPEANFGNRPPLKKKRDDDLLDHRDRHPDERDRREYDRGDRDRHRGGERGRGGREFVRGRGGSRGRGRGTMRGSYSTGSRGKGRDYYTGGYDRGSQGPPRRSDRPLMKQGYSHEDLDGVGREDFPHPRRQIVHLDDSDNSEGVQGDQPEVGRNERYHKDQGGRHEKKEKDGRQSSVSVKVGDVKDKDVRNEDRKQNVEIKNPWSQELKMPLAAPPPPLNVWNKNPLLPSPQDEQQWNVDDNSTELLKEEPRPENNAWIPREEKNVWAQRQETKDQSFQNHEKLMGDGPQAGNKEIRDGKRDDISNRNEYDNRRDNRDKRENRRDNDNRRDDRDRRRNDRRDRDRDDNRPDNDARDNKDRKDRDRFRDRKGERDRGDHDQEHRFDNADANGIFAPRGEPTRRGRGGTRGGRGSSRFTSAPSGRGGFPMSQNGPPGPGHNGEGPNRRPDRRRDGQNVERGGEGGGGTYRRDGRKDNRNPPPPRFQGRGRGSERGVGRGRSSRGRGASAPANLATKKPVLTKQASNEGEEWETASESSEPKNDLRESRETKENTTTKKGVSNQRQFSDRPNSRRVNNQDSRFNAESRNSSKETKQNPKNGVVPPSKPANSAAANGTPPKSKTATVSATNHKENFVFRVDSVVNTDPTAINNAINSLHSKKTAPKKESPEPVKMKTEKEKKDALANIDINNIAGVVIVDDLQEVTIDDPNFLFENNDGFQEVTSKRTLKIKQKLIEAEQKKIEQETKKKEKHLNKVVARPKGLAPKTGRGSLKGSKLPPRLAKQREQREKEKEIAKHVMPKIETWDNTMANTIPSLLSNLDSIPVGSGGTQVSNSNSSHSDDFLDASAPIPTTTIVNSNKSTLSIMVSHTAMSPAPAPAISAWTKPISFATSNTTSALQPLHQAVAAVGDKPVDKADNHDSGIDVSDQPNSAASSTRSSPSADNKLLSSTTIAGLHSLTETICPSQTEASKTTKVSKSDTDASLKILKKVDGSPCKDLPTTKPEPIQMPPSFKDSIFGKGEDSGLQLDFRYDESLATSLSHSLPEPAPVSQEQLEATPVGLKDNITLAAPVNSQQDIRSPTSPATEDLSSKIASVKNFWDPPPASFVDHKTSLAQSSVGVSTTDNLQSNSNTNNASNTSAGSNNVFTNFPHHEVGSGPAVSTRSPADPQLGPPAVEEVGSSSTGHSPAGLHSPHPGNEASGMVDLPQPGSPTLPGTMPSAGQPAGGADILEPSNVCKVRPQQLQGLGSDVSMSGGLSSSLTGGPMPTVASPPMIIPSHNSYPAFQHFLPAAPQDQTRFSGGPGFGLHGMTQQQPPGAHLAAQQQTFSQPSLFVPSTPTQPPELFPFPQPGGGPRSHPGAPGGAPPPPQQHSTIMVSSATSALMSTNIKAPGPPPHNPSGPPAPPAAEPLTKSLGPSQISFSGGLGSGPAPSQQLFLYEPTPPLGQLFQPHNQLFGGSQPSQNLGSSQIFGSQLVPTRTPVQANSSYFPQTASFYPAQQPSSAIQVGGPAPLGSSQFPLQAFSSQPHGLGLSLQPAPAGMEAPAPPPGPPLHHAPPQPLPSGPQQTSKASPFPHLAGGPPTLHQPMAQPPAAGHPQQQHNSHLPSRASQLKSTPGSSSGNYASSGGPNYSQGQSMSKAFDRSGSMGIGSGGLNPRTQPPGADQLKGGLGGLEQVLPPHPHRGAGPPPPPQQPVSRPPPASQSRGFPNPHAPNFPGPSSSSSKLSTSTVGFAPAQPPPSQPPPAADHGTSPVRPSMGGNQVRHPGPTTSQRPPFPSPIQRPGGPPMSGQRPPSMQQFGAVKQPNPPPQSSSSGPLNMPGGSAGPMNMSGNTILSNMLLSAAKSVLNQSMGGHSSGGKSSNSPAGAGPFQPSGAPNKPTPAPGAYMGPSNRSSGGPLGVVKSNQPAGAYPGNSGGGSSGRPAPGSYPGGPLNSLKAQQAQQRQDLLNHAKNFLSQPPASKPPTAPPPAPAASSPSAPEEEKKPALAMVSNPGLVGTSVQINISASSNTRAPAQPPADNTASTAVTEDGPPSASQAEGMEVNGPPTSQ